MYLNWINSGILFINDIIDDKGNISQEIILNKLSNKVNWISEFKKLKNAIPDAWKIILKSPDSYKTKVKTNLEISIGSICKKKNIRKNATFFNLKSKDFYNILRENTSNIPTGFKRWIKLLNLGQDTCRFQIKQSLNFIFQYIV